MLQIGAVLKESENDIDEGILVCSNRNCLSEFPIIHGIPIIVADVRSFISQNILSILSDMELSEPMESLVGDCCGPGSAFDMVRQYVGTYAFDHYGDLDPGVIPGNGAEAGSAVRVLEKGLSGVRGKLTGPVIDIGCAVGRTTFSLADWSPDIVVGVDLNFTMLKTAQNVLQKGIVRYPLRRCGIVYNRRTFPVFFKNAKRVDFWACEAASLGFNARFSMAASIHVLDCVNNPYEHLRTVTGLLKPDATAIFATPYDWSVSATPVESWIGGHSQRSDTFGSPEVFVRNLLTEGKHPYSIPGFEIVEEMDNIPWTVRLHDRSVMHYKVHLFLIRSGKR